jgi:Family of unknown function (DUF5947)
MSPGGFSTSLDVLRQLARKGQPVERCELCSAPVVEGHAHLLELKTRKLYCACTACAILFSGQGARRYKRVPQQMRFLENFRLTDAQWESLMIPINMAFFFESSLEGKRVALYPSPAGATESLLPMESWKEMMDENPALRRMEADVEALLVNRLGAARGYAAPEYYLLPIDECFRLVGLIRAQWRGFSGGTELWAEIEKFFAGLKERCGVGRGSLDA